MKQTIRYVDLSWAVVALCESEGFSFNQLVQEGEIMESVERYVIGYMAFWQIAFIEKERLVPCDDKQLREVARLKIEKFIQEHPPVQRLPHFYLVLLRQNIAPMQDDDMSCVYQM